MQKAYQSKLNKLLFWALIALVLCLVFFAIPKSSISVDAWYAPGDSTINFTTNMGNDTMVSYGNGNLVENNVFNKVGEYNVFDTTYQGNLDNVPPLYKLIEPGTPAAGSGNRRFTTTSGWRVVGQPAWVENFQSDGGAIRLASGALNRKWIFYSTIELSPNTIEGLKNGEIELMFKPKYAQKNNHHRMTSFIALGTGSRDIDNFTTLHGEAAMEFRNHNGDLMALPAQGSTNGSFTWTAGSPKYWQQNANIIYPIAKMNGTYSDLPNNTIVRFGIYGWNESSSSTHADMYDMQFYITKKTGTTKLIANPLSKTYGDANPALGYSLYGVLEGDTVSGVTFNQNFSNDILPGTYSYNIDNYSITNSAYYPGVQKIAANYVVNKRDVTITPKSNQGKIYGSAEGPLEYNNTSLGTYGEALEGSLTRQDRQNENVGSYAIIDNSGTDGFLGNSFSTTRYNLTITPNIIYTISRKDITITPNVKSKIYGNIDQALDFTPMQPADSEWQASQTPAWDLITGSLTRDAGEDVAQYNILQGNVNNATNPNYNITFTANVKFTISRRTVTVSANQGQSKVYYSILQSEENLTFTYTSLKDPNNTAFTPAALAGSVARASGEDVDSYAIGAGSITNENNPNYDISFVSSNYEILQFNVTVTPDSGKTKVYGEADSVFTYSQSATPAKVGYTPLSGSLVRDNDTVQNVGTYQILQGSLTNTNNPNYSITFSAIPVNFEITPKAVVVKILNKTSAYKASIVDLEWVLNTGSSMAYSEVAANTLAVSLSTTATATSNASTYPIKAFAGSTTASNNYSITYINEAGDGTDGVYTITKIDRTLNYTGPVTKAYNGSAQSFTGADFSATDDVNNITYENNTFTDVPSTGKLNITIIGSASTNYNECLLNVEVSVTKINLNIRIENSTSVYNSGALSQLNSTLISGFVASGQDAGKTYIQVISLVLSTNATVDSLVGSYNISQTHSSLNYQATFTGDHLDGDKGIYTITKADSVVSGNIGEYTFNGYEQTVGGLNLNHTESSISYSNNIFTDVPIGERLTVSYSVAESNNYKGIESTSVSVTIHKADTTISTTSVVTSYTYNAALQIINSGATTNQVATANFAVAQIVYDNNSFTNVPESGIQTVTISTASTRNYNAQSVDIDITINKYDISFEIDNKSKIYGQNEPTWTYELAANQAFPGSDGKNDIIAVFNRTNTSEDVGQYDITISTYEDTNYNAIFTKGVLTINPKVITATIENKTSKYNQVEEELTIDSVSLTALLAYSDNISVLDIILTREGANDAGTYAIIGSQGINKSENYTLSFSGTYGDGNQGKGVYVITKGDRIIDTSDILSEYTYNGMQQTITGAKVAESDLDAGETQSIIIYQDNIFTDVPATKTLNVKMSLAATTNYNAYSTSKTVTINPWQIKYNIDDKTSVYATSIVALTGAQDASTPMPPGEDISILSIALTTTATASSNTGQYPITGSWDTTKTNYQVTFIGSYEGGTQGIYIISKRIAEATIDVGEYTFNGARQTITGFSINHTEANLQFYNNSFTDVPTNGKLVLEYWVDETANYEAIARTAYEVSINKAQTTINTAGMTSNYTYNGNLRTVNVGATTNQLGTAAVPVATIVYTNNIFRHVPVGGKQTININTQATQNYLAASADFEITINPASLTASIININKIYGQEEDVLDFTVDSNLLGSDTKESLGVTLERVPGNDIGTYTISKVSQTSLDYDITMPNGQYVISAKSITLIVDDKSSDYKATKEELTASLMEGHTLAYEDSFDDLDVIFSPINENYVGTYPINAYQGENKSNNYLVSFSGSFAGGTQGTYTINKISRTLKKGAGFSETFTYNGQEQIIGGVVLSEADPTGDPSLTYTDNTFTDVPHSGTKTFTVSVAGTRNFEPVAATEFEVAINKKLVTVEIDSKTREYKNVLIGDLTYRVLATTPLVPGHQKEILNISLTTSATLASDVGEYPISATYNNNNYEVSFIGDYTSGTEGKITITKALLSISIDAKETIYGTNVDLTYTIDDSTPLKEGDTKEYLNVVLQRVAGNDVGVYDISYVSGNETNYDITVTSTTKYNILPKQITINILDKQSVYNTQEVLLEFSLDTNTHLSYNEEVEVLDIILSKEAGNNAGIYKITGSQGANKSTNYQVSFSGSYADGISGTYTIAKAQIALDVSGVLANYVYTGSMQTVNSGATASLQVGPYTSEIQYSNNTFTTVTEGNGKKVIVSIAENGNYLGSSKEVTLVVEKAETIIYTNMLVAEYTYNGSEQTVSGSANTNHIGVITTVHFTNNTFTDVPENVPGENYGTKVVSLSTYANDNYNAGSQTFEITIHKAQSSINVATVQKTYTYSSSGHIVTGALLNHNQSPLIYSNHEITDVPQNIAGADYGTQEVTVSVLDSQNYIGTTTSFEVRINKAKQEINTSGIQRSYDSTQPNTFPVSIVEGGPYGHATLLDPVQTIVYTNNYFADADAMEANGWVEIKALGTNNYLEVETRILLVTDKDIPVFDLTQVLKVYTYNGQVQTINSGAILAHGTDIQKANIQYSNNTFVTVEQGNALNVTVHVDADGTFSEKTETFTITVHKADTVISINESLLNVKYNGRVQTVEGFASINHAEGSLQYAYNTFTTVNEGNNLRVLVTSLETPNYKSATKSDIRLNVEKGDTIINLDLMKTVFTYNGQRQTADGARANHQEGSGIIYINNTFRTVAEGNGKEVTIKTEETTNYKASEVKVTLTVNKGSYDLSAVGYINRNVEYNGQMHSLEIFGQLPEGVSVSYSSIGHANAGSYNISANFLGDVENYNIIPSKTATLTITPSTYDFTKYFFTDKVKVYNSQDQSIEFEGIAPIGFDNSTPQIEYVGALKDVGSTEIIARVISVSDNYTIAIAEYSATLTITQVEISISSGVRYESLYQDVDIVNLVSGNYVIDGLYQGDDINLTFTSEFEDKGAVGKAFVKMLVASIDNNNYRLPVTPYETLIDAVIIYPIVIDILQETYVFDNLPKVMPASATIAGQDVEYSVHFIQNGKTLNKAVNAGIYTMVVSVEDEYAGTNSLEQEMKIERANSSIILSGNYNQTYAIFERFAASLKVDNNDGSVHKINIKYSFNTNMPVVGTHSVHATFNGSTNYLPSEIKRYFTVAPIKVELTFRDNNRYPYTGQSQNIEYSLSHQNPEDTDIILISYGIDNPVGLGEYSIQFVVNNPNYEIVGVYGPQTIIITRAKLKISIKPMIAVENKKLTFEYILDGLVGDDTKDVLRVSPRVDGDTFEAGSYNLTPYGASADNYDISYNQYKLSVYKENLTKAMDSSTSMTITGYYDPKATLEVKHAAGFDFFDPLFKLTNVIQNAYRIEIVGGSEQEIVNKNTRLVYRDSQIKSSILNGVYFIDENGNKIKIKSSDIKDGVLDTRFNGQSGYIVVYKNYTIVYVSIITAVAVVLIFLYLSSRGTKRGSTKARGLKKYY